MDRKRNMVCVLGMHRSGTSMLCQILDKMGVYFGGKEELYEGDEFNQDGYYELKEIRIQYDRLFAACGSSWRATNFIEEKFKEEGIKKYTEGIRRILKRNLSGKAELCGFKDPSTSVLLPLMRGIFDSLEFRPAYLVMIRNPLEVSGSLVRREQISESHSLRLWMKYYISILEHIDWQHTVFLTKEGIIGQTEAAYQLLCRCLYGEEKPYPEQQIKGCIKVNYLHSAYEEKTVEEAGFPLLTELYQFLLELSQRALNQKAGLQMLEEDREKIRSFREQYQCIYEKEAVADAYEEMEYRRTQLKSFLIQFPVYELWLKNKMEGVSCGTYLKLKNWTKVGIEGQGELADWLRTECEQERLEVRSICLATIVEEVGCDVIILVDNRQVENREKFIKAHLGEGNRACHILSLEALLKEAYQQKQYQKQSREKKKCKRMLVLKSKSLAYASTYYFADCLAEEFEKLGYETDVAEVEQIGEEGLERLLTREYRAIFDFNSQLPLAELEEKGCYLNAMGAPFFNILIDHPLYYHPSLKAPLQDYHVFCVDEAHTRYVTTYYSQIKSVYTMPIPGIYAGKWEKLKPQKERTCGILLPATYKSLSVYESEIQSAIPPIRAGVWNMIERMKADAKLSLEEAFGQMLQETGIEGLDSNQYATLLHGHFQAEMYRNAYYRDKMVRFLLKQGISMTVLGQGWEMFDGEGKENLTILPAVDFKETTTYMQNAKIVLNIMHGFQEGCHDRILSTMRAGAVSMTARNPYIEQLFQENHEILTFDWDKPEELVFSLRQALENVEKLQNIAKSGYERAEQKHTWKNRAESILKYLDKWEWYLD